MRLFAAEAGETGRAGTGASALAYKLLEYAVWKEWGIKCPQIERDEGGKPYFAGESKRHFSISHTRSHVMVGLSESDLGVDIETVRPVKNGLEERLFSSQMRERFSFFEGWTLRESIFKLTGTGGLMSMELSVIDGEIVTPFEGVKCKTYNCIAGCVAAVACRDGDFPDTIEIVERDIICLEK